VRIEPLTAVREPARPQQAGNLVAQIVASRQSQGAQEPERDRLAVAEAGVARRRLDRVRHRVAQVEHLATALVALVLSHYRELGAQAAQDGRDVRAGACPPALPPWASGAQRGLA